MENPKVPIITALYNAEKFIDRAAKSVAEQTYKNICWNVVDDCSNDKSINVLLECLSEVKTQFVDDGPQWHRGVLRDNQNVVVTVIPNKINVKQGACRNRAILASEPSVPLFKVLDSDDYMLPTCIEKHVNAWLKSPEDISCVYSDYLCQDDSTGITLYEYKQSFSYDELHRHCIVSSGCMFPKWALEKVGLYFEDESPCEDYGLELRLANVGTMIHLASAEWVYRLHGNNATIKDLDKHRAAFPIMQQNYIKWREQRGIK